MTAERRRFLWEEMDRCLELEELLQHPVDLVMADAVRNPYGRRDIEASKQLINEA